MASNAAPSSASVPICDLKRGDVVVFESAWSLNGAVIAVVIDRTGQGPRLIAPGQSEPQLARAGTVRDVLDVDELLGLDARGDYHLVADDDDVAGPGSASGRPPSVAVCRVRCHVTLHCSGPHKKRPYEIDPCEATDSRFRSRMSLPDTVSIGNC